MVVLLRADVRLVHILERDSILSNKLGGTAVPVVFLRTATVVGQVCKGLLQLHPQAYTRYHRSLVSFGHEAVIYLDNSVGIYLIGDVPMGICLRKKIGHLDSGRIITFGHMETFGFRFLVTRFFPCFETDGEFCTIVIVRWCTPEEGLRALTVQNVFMLLVQIRDE